MTTPDESDATEPQCAEVVKPELAQVMKSLADAGDLAGLLNAIIAKPPAAADLPSINRMLRRAVHQASVQSSRRFTRAVYREALAFLAYVQMRLHTYTIHGLGAGDPMRHDHVEAIDKAVALVERLMRLSLDVSQRWASTTREWERASKSGGKSSKRRRPRSLNEVYERLVEDGEIPPVRTC